MRVRNPLMLLCVLMVAAAPAFGATRKEHDDCNADDVDRNIAGCTRVAQDPGESKKTRAIAYVGRGLAWRQKGDIDRAMADFTDAIRLNPNDSLAYNNRAILWRDKGDPDRAIEDFNRAIEIDPLPRSDLAGIPHVNLYSNRGLAFEAKGDLDRALSDFDKALSLDADDAEAYLRRGHAFLSKPDLDRAVADFGAAIRLDPGRPDAYYFRGYTLYHRYVKGSAWVERDDLEGAIADFTVMIRMRPEAAFAYYARGLAYNINGDRDHAVADMSEAVRLDPLNPELTAALKALKPDYVSASDSMNQYFKRPAADSKQ